MKYFELFLIFSFFVLILNIIILIKNKSLRNIDLIFLIYNKINYKNISLYLNSKYDIKIVNSFKKENSKKKRKIDLYFTGFLNSKYQNKQKKNILKILNKKFEISINPDNPVYLIYNVFGCKYLKERYNNSIKIAYFTENQLPDFNIADYAVGQAHLNYFDRYMKIPYVFGWFKHLNNSYIKYIRELALNGQKRKKFCAAVISNNRSSTRFRIKFIIIFPIKSA